MQQAAVIENFFRVRYSFFKWRYSLAWLNKIALAFGMACATGILAQARIPLFWTPVPITGQTFAVLLAGVLLGRYWGGISQAMYVAIGAAGVPWFNGFSGGLTVLAGPTGGYLIGFILAALFLGHFTDKYIKARSFFSIFSLMLFANFILIYILGLFQLSFWFYLAKGASPTLWELLMAGAIPFIAGDTLKIIAAATLAHLITPKEAFNGEADA
ncbi:biotin transporter BioY [bacterium]|nr:biotin transporter BioY [bacterium]